LKEDKLPFPTLFDPFQPLTCKQPKPKAANTTQNKLNQNAIASLLLLLHTIQKIQLEAANILPNALAISLFAFWCQGQVARMIRQKNKTGNILRSSQTLFSTISTP
jgi:hypothetical protein